MEEQTSYQSWTISDELWEEIKGYVPTRERDPNKEYKCAPGRGRKPIPPRKVLEGILYVLRNGCLWKALPKEYGAASSVHQYFQEWQAAGFFEMLWAMGLKHYDVFKGIDWEWQSVDGSIRKSPLGGAKTGPNPTDRGKKGVKQSVLTNGKGIPLAVVLSGANTHDVKLLEETLQGIVVFRPLASLEHPQNLCLDAGYTGSAAAVERYGYTAHIRPRGEEKKELERNPDFKARRWVVEVCHSWLNRFRKILVRFELKDANYLALVQFACALIVWRQFIHIHQ